MDWTACVNRRADEANAAGVPDVIKNFELVTALSSFGTVSTVPKAVSSFLMDAGLPRGCAPFLSFDALREGPRELAHLCDSASAGLYVIGYDGAGNPICLDSNLNWEVTHLDHEDEFQTRAFVASSVFTLAEALVLIQTHLPNKNFIFERLQEIDPSSASATSFFPREL